MKKTIRYTIYCLLITLALTLIGCDGGSGEGEETFETLDPSWTMAPTTAREEITQPNEELALAFVPSAELSENAEVLAWFTGNTERSQVAHAILCAKDEGDGAWYCWLYVPSATAQDSLTFAKDTKSGVYILRYTSAEGADTTLPTAGAWYFRVTGERPQFEILTGGENVGVLVTYADDPVKR